MLLNNTCAETVDWWSQSRILRMYLLSDCDDLLSAVYLAFDYKLGGSTQKGRFSSVQQSQ